MIEKSCTVPKNSKGNPRSCSIFKFEKKTRETFWQLWMHFGSYPNFVHNLEFFPEKGGILSIFCIISVMHPIHQLTKDQKTAKMGCMFHHLETSRDRPKSASYIRLKNSKRTSKCQSIGEYGTPLRKKIEKSLTMPKKLKGGTFGLVRYCMLRGKSFWFSSLGQLVQFSVFLNICRIFGVELFWSLQVYRKIF